MIQSENFVEGVSGFRMKADGELEASNGTFRGHIEATSGFFHGRIEADEGIFRGSIISGPLVLMEQAPASNVIAYSAGTGAMQIVEAELARNGVTSLLGNRTFSIAGTYAGQNIVSIRFYASSPSRNWWVYVTYQNGTETEIARQHQQLGQGQTQMPLSSQLSFAYTSGGKTFRLVDLPTQDPHVPGAVWRIGNQLMISL